MNALETRFEDIRRRVSDRSQPVTFDLISDVLNTVADLAVEQKAKIERLEKQNAALTEGEQRAWAHAREERAAALAAEERVRVLSEALAFYADPWNHPRKKAEDLSVPDFYDEMDFGSTASENLAALQQKEVE